MVDKELDDLREFYDPDTVELMHWIKYVHKILGLLVMRGVNTYLKVPRLLRMYLIEDVRPKIPEKLQHKGNISIEKKYESRLNQHVKIMNFIPKNKNSI